MHAGYSLGVVGGGNTGVGGIFFVMEECVFYVQCVGSKNMQEILSTDIASWNTVWSKSLFLFVAGAHTNSCIDVASHYNLCVGADGAEHGIKCCAELVVMLVLTWKVY
jgi:hypothetical protein